MARTQATSQLQDNTVTKLGQTHCADCLNKTQLAFTNIGLLLSLNLLQAWQALTLKYDHLKSLTSPSFRLVQWNRKTGWCLPGCQSRGENALKLLRTLVLVSLQRVLTNHYLLTYQMGRETHHTDNLWPWQAILLKLFLISFYSSIKILMYLRSLQSTLLCTPSPRLGQNTAVRQQHTGAAHPHPPKPHEPLHTAGVLPPSTPALAEC